MPSFLEEYINGGTTTTLGNRAEELDFSQNKRSIPRPPPRKHVAATSYIKENQHIVIRFKVGRNSKEEEMIIPKREITPDLIVDKSIIAYGGTESGKTTFIKDLLYVTQRTFPMVFGFLPTNSDKHDFDTILPAPLIFEKITLDNIKEIYERQKMAAEFYNNANDIKVLARLFKRVATPQLLNHARFTKKSHMRELTRIKNSDEPPYRKTEMKNNAESDYNSEIIKFYKKTINDNIKKIEKIRDLSDDEKNAVEYRRFNPHVLCVFDDAYTEVDAIMREGKKKSNKGGENEEVVRDFFIKGRHKYIGHVHGIQGDNISPEIRKNAHRSFLGNEAMANSFFSKSSMGFSARQEKIAAAISRIIFNDPQYKHCKLLYSRLEANPWSYIRASLHSDTDIKMCSAAAKQFCEDAKNNKKFDTNNSFYKNFVGE